MGNIARHTCRLISAFVVVLGMGCWLWRRPHPDPQPLVVDSGIGRVVVLTTDTNAVRGLTVVYGSLAHEYVVDTVTFRLATDAQFRPYLSDSAVRRLFANNALVATAGHNVVYKGEKLAVFAEPAPMAYMSIGLASGAVQRGSPDFASDVAAFRLANAGYAFPWPPPSPSAAKALPPGTCTNSTLDTLGVTAAKLERRLNRSAIREWRYYRVAENGFAIVTNQMQLDDTGSVVERAAEARTFVEPKSLLSVEGLRRMVLATPGRFVVLVLVVTPLQFEVSPTSLSPEESRDAVRLGSIQIDRDLARKTVNRANCIALVYEYSSRNRVDAPIFSKTARQTAAEILSRLRLWSTEEMQR